MENMDQILDAPQTEKTQLQYAGFWIRFAAYLLDGVLLSGVLFVVALAGGDVFLGPVGSIVNLVIGVTYFTLMESSSNQATLGKMAVSIKVGDRNGDQLSALNALGRYFAKIPSAIILGIGFLMVAWDDKNQGLHDKLADTYVFYKR